jgi:hypothetical protein
MKITSFNKRGRADSEHEISSISVNRKRHGDRCYAHLTISLKPDDEVSARHNRLTRYQLAISFDEFQEMMAKVLEPETNIITAP